MIGIRNEIEWLGNLEKLNMKYVDEYEYQKMLQNVIFALNDANLTLQNGDDK